MKQPIVGIIYLTVNLVNGMGYVGFHHTSADDGYFGSGLIIERSIKKNSKRCFRRIVLDHYCTKEERINKEVYWINRLDMRNRNIGYNIDSGGNGGNGGSSSLLRKKGKQHPAFGVIRSNSFKIKVRKNNPRCKKIKINDNVFQSIRDAGRKMNMCWQTIQKRLISKKFKEYVYVD